MLVIGTRAAIAKFVEFEGNPGRLFRPARRARARNTHNILISDSREGEKGAEIQGTHTCVEAHYTRPSRHHRLKHLLAQASPTKSR